MLSQSQPVPGAWPIFTQSQNSQSKNRNSQNLTQRYSSFRFFNLKNSSLANPKICNHKRNRSKVIVIANHKNVIRKKCHKVSSGIRNSFWGAKALSLPFSFP